MPCKKFLLLSSYTFPETSGSGINAYNFAKALNNNGHKAKVLSFSRNFKTVKSDNVIRIPYFSRTMFGKLCSLPVIFLYYFYYVLRSNVLIIYGNRIIAWEVAVLLAKLFGKKIVFRSLLLGVDDVLSTIQNSKLAKNFYRRIFNSIHCYYSINKSFSEKWMNEFGKSGVLFECPQGVETSLFKPEPKNQAIVDLKKRLNIDTQAFIIQSAGFLIERKQPLKLFNAIEKLSFNYKYVYLGDYKFGNTHFLRYLNSDAETIHRKGKEILKDKVLFTGFVQNISSYLKCADVFIHASTGEVPNVVYEAMATSVPVIISREAVSLSTVLQHEVNCLVYSDEKEIPQLIETIKTNEQLRKKVTANALEWINREAAFPVVVKKINHFLF